MRRKVLRFQQNLSAKLFLSLILITSLLFLPIKLLEIRTEEGTYICSLFFNSEVIITLSYIHSVSLTEVIDKFKVTGDGIWAIESRWQQFDAGQPIDFNRIENGFFVKEMRLFLGNEWIYWFIPLNRPSIRLDGKYLVQEMRKEGKVKFKLRKEPLVFIIFSWEGVKWIN